MSSTYSRPMSLSILLSFPIYWCFDGFRGFNCFGGLGGCLGVFFYVYKMGVLDVWNVCGYLGVFRLLVYSGC